MWGKRGQHHQAIGRSRGGITSKIHTIVDALGNPLRFVVTAGNLNDCSVGFEMLEEMDVSGKIVLADRGYDTDRIVDLLDEKKAICVIPSRMHRKVQRSYDWWLYKERHLVECFFNKLKHYRRLATRYDKLAASFSAFLALAACLVWIR